MRWSKLRSIAAGQDAFSTPFKDGDRRVPLLRRMGFRTAQEIEKERHAVKAVRGDYKALERIKPMRRKSANKPGKIATAA